MKAALRQGLTSEARFSLLGRHRRLFEALGQFGAPCLFVVTPGPWGGAYGHHTIRADIAYLSALDEPDVIAAFYKDGATERSLLFKKERNAFYELWNGPMRSISDAQSDLGFSEVIELQNAEKELAALLKKSSILFHESGSNTVLDRVVLEAIASSAARRDGLEIRESRGILAQLRLLKDSFELNCLLRANEITSRGHELAMQYAKPGQNEFEIRARLEYGFGMLGGQGLGYDSIVASGSNACCLHYTVNSCQTSAGELVLVDAGAMFGGYTADVTRTFPISGKFTSEQAIIYDIVLETQKACIEIAQPGESLVSLQNFAVRKLCEGLRAAGLLEQSVDACIQSEDYKRFYPHSIGHWLGRVVHDVGARSRGGAPLAFEAGHVITVEPGIYIQPNDERFPESFRGIGVRIEDNIHITDDGAQNLTTAVKQRQDIEALMLAATGNSQL